MNELMNDTDEMEMCFNEMEKLRAKMEALREKRKANEEKRLLYESTMDLYESTMEPNLKVLKTRVDELAIENTNKKATDQMKAFAINIIRSTISNMIEIDNEYQELADCDKYRIYGSNGYKYRNIHFGQLREMLVSLEDDPYNVLSKKKSMVEQLYNTGTYEHTAYVKQRTIHDEINISHIEATYNMFNIINKRLDDIEGVSVKAGKKRSGNRHMVTRSRASSAS